MMIRNSDCEERSNAIITAMTTPPPPATTTTTTNRQQQPMMNNRRKRTRRTTHRGRIIQVVVVAAVSVSLAAVTTLPLLSVTAFLSTGTGGGGGQRRNNIISTRAATTNTPTDTTTDNTNSQQQFMVVSDLQKTTKDVSEFELSVGRALDTLRDDYPYLLTTPPDFSLYSRDIEVVDPSGVRVHGLQAYKNSWRLLHAIVKIVYCTEKSQLNFRMCYDKARQNIRCSFNSVLVPREIFGGKRTILHVDGISVYEFDRDNGNITQHRIEHLLINNEKVQPEEGVIAALQAEQNTMTVPSFAKNNCQMVVEYSTNNNGGGRPTSLFAMEASGPDQQQAVPSSSSSSSSPTSEKKNMNHQSGGGGGGGGGDGFDWDALDRKNKSRKKFGLKPLSREEFDELEAQVQQLAQQQQQKQQQSAATQAAAEMNEKKPNFFEKLIGDVLQDTCESNFDCERPEICCDFGFKKMCCASGTPVGASQGVPQYAFVPVPVGIEDPPGKFGRNF